jgi:hypothetical protein
MNGELKLDNDLLADELTRPCDLAFEQSVAFQRNEVNSVLCDRANSFKKKYFRLDINFGKVVLQNCKNLFSEEDKLARTLLDKYREYEQRTSLAMIPFYESRYQFITSEIDLKQRANAKKEDIDFLTKTKDDVHRKLEQEKREIQTLATGLYETWTKIQEVRTAKKFTSTNVDLKVTRAEVNGLDEFSFNLTHTPVSSKKTDGSSLPNNEASRRSSCNNIKAFAKLHINGKAVAKTRDFKMKWPQFEIELCEQF